jgi:hypothetical protein
VKQVKVIFGDAEIVDFCNATRDTNEIHDPAFMAGLGKRVIVPGMLALSYAANLSGDFLKTRANYIKVLFNSLLSSGDFVTLSAEPNPANGEEVRLSAFNHKDTLTSRDEYTRMSHISEEMPPSPAGIIRRLEVDPRQLEMFCRLVRATDPDLAHFLFSVSYASQALLKSINEAETEVEKEIAALIGGDSKISPFYQSLEIFIPSPFPVFEPRGALDYFIHFERDKPLRLYTAHVRCESGDRVVFYSRYKMVGIPDMIIIRMAKEIHRHR